MLQDSQGLDVSTDSPETLAAINRYTDQALIYGKDTVAIFRAIEADPNCAIANAHAAALYFFHEQAESRRLALPYLQAAKQYKDKATEREQLYICAVEAWAIGAINQSLTYLEVLTEQFPRDLVAVQMGQYHYFYQGNSEGLLAIAEKVFPTNRENHHIYGMIAFGLVQCHRLQEAEATGRLATAMNRNNPWAHHAVAHVLETQGRLEEGIAWMESLCDTWEDCNSMLYTHNWWHIALYYLEKDEYNQVLSLYDIYIWGRAQKDSSKDPIDAISLLLRLELRGVDVGQRWQELAPYLTARIHEHTLPFQDLHYIYALSRAGQADKVTEMLLSMQAYAKTAHSCVRRVWNEVAVPAARGMAAHAQGKWERAIHELGLILPRLHTIGGSHTQRDLFEQVYLDAWLRANHNQEAIKLLEKRVASRRYIPFLRRKSGMLSNRRGLIQLPTRKTVPMSQNTMKPERTKQWIEQIDQSKDLALAKT